MAISVIVEGVEKQTSVSSAAALATAIANAKPGEVVTLNTVVAPFVLTISSPKRAPGISVILPSSQVLRTVFNGQDLYTEVVGGIDSADAVNGNTTTNPAYSCDLGNSSKFARRGMILGQGSNCVTGIGASDCILSDFVIQWARADAGQFVRCKRVLISNYYGRDTTIKGHKLLWYSDGRQPVDNSPNIADNIVSFWVDTPHNDIFQLRNESGLADFTQDITIINGDCEMQGAGIVAFGQPALGGQTWVRVRVSYNRIRTQDNGAIVAFGDHVEVSYNDVGPHPTDPGDGGGSVNITLIRSPSESRVRGGGNTFNGGAIPVNPDGVDLAGPVLTGDSVDPPVLPNLPRLPWAPPVVRPAYQAYTGTPEMISPPGVYHTAGGGATAPAGTWVTWGLGTLRGGAGATYEVRLKRDGVIVPGFSGRTYQLQVGDTNITLEMRWTNANGTGAWRASAPVSVA